MNLMIHDLDSSQFQKLFGQFNLENNMCVISDNGSIRNCTGCFGCWVKTPGRCVIKDGYDNTGRMLSRADNVIIISRCCYGGYSPFVKNVLDRSISYLLPFFKTKKNETHHKSRYQHTFSLSVYFYGDSITKQERNTARSFVKAHSLNFNVPDYSVSFFESLDQLCRKVKTK